MRIVFLDFDGVLNTLTDPELPEALVQGSVEWCAAQLSEVRIGYLNEILALTGAKVVLSTSWREVYPQRHLVEALELKGFEGMVLGCVPSLSSTKLGRKTMAYDGIMAWVSAVAPDGFIILDDMDMGPLHAHLLKLESGLEERHINEAVTLFSSLSW